MNPLNQRGRRKCTNENSFLKKIFSNAFTINTLMDLWEKITFQNNKINVNLCIDFGLIPIQNYNYLINFEHIRFRTNLTEKEILNLFNSKGYTISEDKSPCQIHSMFLNIPQDQIGKWKLLIRPQENLESDQKVKRAEALKKFKDACGPGCKIYNFDKIFTQSERKDFFGNFVYIFVCHQVSNVEDPQSVFSRAKIEEKNVFLSCSCSLNPIMIESSLDKTICNIHLSDQRKMEIKTDFLNLIKEPLPAQEQNHDKQILNSNFDIDLTGDASCTNNSVLPVIKTQAVSRAQNVQQTTNRNTDNNFAGDDGVLDIFDNNPASPAIEYGLPDMFENMNALDPETQATSRAQNVQQTTNRNTDNDIAGDDGVLDIFDNNPASPAIEYGLPDMFENMNAFDPEGDPISQNEDGETSDLFFQIEGEYLI